MGFSGANWESVNLSDVYCGVSGGQLGYYGSVGGGGGGHCVSMNLSKDQWGSLEVSGAQWWGSLGFCRAQWSMYTHPFLGNF